ncbi:MAG: hypothetical protein NT062_09130 [Proteobacteria bacterium]|nr:hypothetical protein [Pseudomonadota bacterium]
MRVLVCCVLLFGSLAQADSKKRPAPKPVALAGRVVDLEVMEESRIVTVLIGTENGLGKQWRAKFREGTTTKPLAGGEAVVIRIDRRSTVLKTSLSAEQVRANRVVQFEP